MKKRKTPKGDKEQLKRMADFSTVHEEFFALDFNRRWDIEQYIEKMDYQDKLKMARSIDLIDLKWVDGLPYMPDEWDCMGEGDKLIWLLFIHNTIESFVGEKALFRYDHKRNYGMTDQAIDDLWERRRFRLLMDELKKCNDHGKNGCDSRYESNDIRYFDKSLAFLFSSLAFLFTTLALCLIFALFFH